MFWNKIPGRQKTNENSIHWYREEIKWHEIYLPKNLGSFRLPLNVLNRFRFKDRLYQGSLCSIYLRVFNTQFCFRARKTCRNWGGALKWWTFYQTRDLLPRSVLFHVSETTCVQLWSFISVINLFRALVQILFLTVVKFIPRIWSKIHRGISNRKELRTQSLIIARPSILNHSTISSLEKETFQRSIEKKLSV